MLGLRLCLGAKERGEAISVGLVGNIAAVLPELLRRDIIPDIVTDQTTTGLLTGYIPLGLTPDEVEEMKTSDRATLTRRGQETIAIHMRAMLELGRRGAEIFEYGNGLRVQARDRERLPSHRCHSQLGEQCNAAAARRHSGRGR